MARCFLGLLAPLVMWNGDPATDAVYLHIRSQLFEYKGALKPTADGPLQLPGASSSAMDAPTGTQLTIDCRPGGLQGFDLLQQLLLGDAGSDHYDRSSVWRQR
jgi:hypothetical protein